MANWVTGTSICHLQLRQLQQQEHQQQLWKATGQRAWQTITSRAKKHTHTHTQKDEPKRVSCGPWSASTASSEEYRKGEVGPERGEGLWYATGDSLSNYWDCNFGLAIASNRIFWQAARNWKLNCRSMTMSKVKEKRERSETTENEAHSWVATVNGKSEKEAVHLSVNDLIQLHCEPSSRLLKSLSILGFYSALSHGQQIAVELLWNRVEKIFNQR